jgi:hypothetical protein
MSERRENSNPYAPPREAISSSGGVRYVALQLGLAWYAALGLLSAPFAVLAFQQMQRALQGLTGAEAAFNTLAAVFYGIRAIGDVGLVAAFVAGLLWLHRAWTLTQARGRRMSVSARGVLGWCLVPVWGHWRLHGFLLELSKRNGVSEDFVKVGRWWWVMTAHLVVRVTMAMNHLPGWLHVGDSLLQASAAVLGMQMVSRLQRALGRAPVGGRT